MARDARAAQDPQEARSRGVRWVRPLLGLAAAASLACVFTPPPPLPEEVEAEAAAEAARLEALRSGEAAEAGGGGGGPAGIEPGVTPIFAAGQVAPSGMNAAQMKAYNIAQGDPEEGEFTLQEALAGLGGVGTLTAEIVTPRGVLRCELFEKDAPLTVANFVGLARGLRPFLDKQSGTWVKRPYYDHTTFHRVIPGFMIQAGDPTATGTGNPGYVILDEIRPSHTHEEAGALSMANRGPGTGGAQFFITLGPTPHLDGKHTVFGQCDEASAGLADDIALVPRDPETDQPTTEETVDTIRIVRR
ncbi:MAG: peptidylprolyl isomerase [Nannocystaceae bacterium]